MSRPYVIVDAEQRSDAWFAARAGRITASKADALYANGRSGQEAAARRDYRSQIVLERILGKPLEDGNGYQNADMARGVELEPAAFALYEATTGQVVRRTGFVAHVEQPWGVSPDGDVDEFTGLVELKAPRPANHLGYLRAGVVPSAYIPQITHGQLVTGALWTDFVSFCPQFPEALQLFVVRVPRDEKAIAAHRLVLEQFLSEIEREEAEIRALMAAKVA